MSERVEIHIICPGCESENLATYEVTTCSICGDDLPLIEPGAFRVVSHDEENHVLVLRREDA